MPNLPWSDALAAQLASKRQQGRYRKNRIRDSHQGVNITVDGKPMLSFCSNDYLGLANHPKVKQALIEAIAQVGVGSGAAHLLAGHHRYHHQLEEALAEFIGHERVLLYSSGYQANMGIIDGLLGKDDAVLQDKLNHASLLDAGRLSAAKQWRYRHADTAALARRLQQTDDIARRLIVTDGVFSMDGDSAPLTDIMALAQAHRTGVLVDDAHAIGVIGERGQGSLANLTTETKPIVMATFGKALGTAGAFVAADETIIETLIQQSRTFVYTTAQPAALAFATLTSLQLAETETWRRDKLNYLIAQFRRGAQALGLELMDSNTPIQPILIGEIDKVNQVGEALEIKGILVASIRPPTVAEGSARLRVTLSAEHSEQDVTRLLESLEGVLCT